MDLDVDKRSCSRVVYLLPLKNLSMVFTPNSLGSKSLISPAAINLLGCY